MDTEEKIFTIRFSLAATIPAALQEEDDFEEGAWLAEWESQIKPGLIRAVFGYLRSFPRWQAHIRNRGISPMDEIEIALERSFVVPPSPQQ